MSTALQVNDTTFNMAEVLEENGVTFNADSFTKITMPKAGGKYWELVNEEGVAEPKAYLEGIIIARQTVRNYYSQPYDAANPIAPDCVSLNGQIGFGTPGGSCKTCPMAKWRDGAPACTAKLYLYLLQPGEMMPVIVVLRSSSFRNLDTYINTLAMKGGLFYGVKTRIGLQVVKSKNGFEYAQATFAAASALSPEDLAAARQQKQFFTALVQRAGLEAPVAAMADEPATQGAFVEHPDGTTETPNGLTF